MAERRAKPFARLAFQRLKRDDGFMADCPGIVHLALMADGGLARLRAPGGMLDAAKLRAVAHAAERLGSGVVDLTNRANLQIRGLKPGGGRELAETLEVAGFRFHGEADRRRNILVDPFAGLDPIERRDMRPLAEALDQALIVAPWIGGLSPKFSFALDGGGASGVAAVASDVTAIACGQGISVLVGGRIAKVADEEESLKLMTGLAEAAARLGGEARAGDIEPGDFSGFSTDAAAEVPELSPRFGAVPTAGNDRVALSLAVPVGRLDPKLLRFLADLGEAEGDGFIRLAPWSGVVISGVAVDRAGVLLDGATEAGFTPPEVAERLRVVACAGAPSCERAREPAKALGAAVLDLARAEPGLLPDAPATLHLSACPKGCGGAGSADLLLLGASDRPGWSLHRGGAPRRPGAAVARLERVDPHELLALLAHRG